MTTVSAPEYFRENLRRYLAEPHAPSQRSLAAEAGIHFTHLNRILHGTVSPTIEMAQKISDAIGVTLDELVSAPKKNFL